MIRISNQDSIDASNRQMRIIRVTENSADIVLMHDKGPCSQHEYRILQNIDGQDSSWSAYFDRELQGKISDTGTKIRDNASVFKIQFLYYITWTLPLISATFHSFQASQRQNRVIDRADDNDGQNREKAKIATRQRYFWRSLCSSSSGCVVNDLRVIVLTFHLWHYRSISKSSVVGFFLI